MSRNLQEDLDTLKKKMSDRDLSDEFLKKCFYRTRNDIPVIGANMIYGITFVESNIALEWLERAIKAEEEIKLNDQPEHPCKTNK